MAERIVTLMSDEKLRQKMAQAAKQSSDKFDLPVVMQHWDNLFREVKKNEF